MIKQSHLFSIKFRWISHILYVFSVLYLGGPITTYKKNTDIEIAQLSKMCESREVLHNTSLVPLHLVLKEAEHSVKVPLTMTVD